ncbi:MAG: hypothetical protein AMXMBFR84_42420 [Candidatus Hydrogenedentota bacterium]
MEQAALEVIASSTADQLLKERIAFRGLQEADLQLVCGLIGAAMNSDEEHQAHTTLITHLNCQKNGIPDGRVYELLLVDNSVAGIGGLHHYAWGPPKNVWLAWFAVDPRKQGQGLGTRLLNRLLDRARHDGFKKLYVETYSSPEFQKARDFYCARGFRLGGYVTSYLPSGDDMVVYYKDLTHVQP